MAFTKLSYEDARAQGELAVTLNGEAVDDGSLETMTVDELAKAKIVMYGDTLRLDTKDHRHWLDIGSMTTPDEKQLVRDNPESYGVYWRGVASSPMFPKEPNLPGSNALEFLRQQYADKLAGMNDKGKIGLD